MQFLGGPFIRHTIRNDALRKSVRYRADLSNLQYSRSNEALFHCQRPVPQIFIEDPWVLIVRPLM